MSDKSKKHYESYLKGINLTKPKEIFESPMIYLDRR